LTNKLKTDKLILHKEERHKTMAIHYQISSGEDTSGATILFSDGEVINVTSTHPSYAQIVKLLIEGTDDEESLLALTLPALTAGKSLNRLSERVIYDTGTIYFDGDPIDASIANHIVNIIQEGGNENSYGALVKFLEKLYQNPSEASRNSLYDFLVRNSFTITPDGDFLAYKGVNADGRSINSGYGIVDGVVHQNARLLNNVGSTLEMPRLKVDDDTGVGCSTGLHAGTYNYAKNFARGMLLLVKINPRDVVSVPKDCNFQKIRTCRYVVLTQTEVKYEKTTYAYTDNDWADDRPKNRSAKTRAKETVKREYANLTVEEAELYDLVEESNDGGWEIFLDFDYTSKSGKETHVERFVPEKVTIKNDDLLITGRNNKDEFRSYLFSRMTNVQDLDPDGQEYGVESETDFKTPVELNLNSALKVDLQEVKKTEEKTEEVFITGDEWAARTFAALHDEE
jgi:hypothetical protein